MTDLSNLAECVSRFESVRLLCLGDVMLDRFIYGDVSRISPEGPIPVMRVEAEKTMLGGAGNVARNITSLGAEVTFLSAVGNDDSGNEILRLIGADPKIEPYIQRDSARPTTLKTRYVAAGQQLLRTDTESVAPILRETRQALTEISRSAIRDADVLILSDYAKGVLAPALIRSVIDVAKTHNTPVIVDPKGRDYARYAGATVLTPNLKELQAATGLPTATDQDIITAAQSLRQNHDIDTVLVTRSQDGMTLVSAGEVAHMPALTREVFDVSGAGDTVVATLAAALGCAMPLADCARLANTAAGIAVGKRGTAVVHGDELIAGLHQQDLMSGEHKLMSLELMAALVRRWQSGGKRVGFTNGCFDLLHPGHLSLLQQCRGACDRLIVGLNSDASVKRLKGDHRPVQSEAARAAVLGSLEMVAGVVIFNEDTPISLIETLKPDLLVKGADYSIDTVVGAKIVQAYGGTVMLAKLKDGFSTTGTIARMHSGGQEQGPEV